MPDPRQWRMAYKRLSFVDGSPELCGKKRELRIAQCRAHAARVTHSRAKRGFPPPSPQRAVLTLTLDSPDLSSPDSTTKADGSPEQEQSSVALERRNPISPSALSPKADPFAILEPYGLPDYVHALMKFAGGFEWTDTFGYPVRHAATQLIDVHRVRGASALQLLLSFHCYTVSNILQLKLRRPNPDRTHLDAPCLRHKGIALKLLQEELNQGNHNTPSDYAVFATLILAVHEIAPTEEISSQKRYPESPLAKASLLHFHGHLGINSEHVKGLYTLIEMLGPEYLQTSRLTKSLQIADLYFATSFDVPPRLPWFLGVNSSEFMLFGLNPDETSIFPIGSRHNIWNANVESVCCQSLSASSSKAGTFFRGVRWLHHSCASIARNMGAASSLLKTSASSDDNGTLSPALLVAIRARNRIQHDLTSLRRLGTNPRNASQASVINEICRLGLLIYSDLILFVTPIQSGIRKKYARKLLSILIVAEELSLWNIEEGFLTWAAFMGGMASHMAPDLRNAYVKTLVDRVLGVFEKTGEPTMEQLKNESLQGFLWWDPVCDPQALDLWNMALELRR